MNFDPDGEVIRVGGFMAEFEVFEARGSGGGVMAGGSVFLKKCLGARERGSGGDSRCGEKKGDNDQRRRQLCERPRDGRAPPAPLHPTSISAIAEIQPV